MIKMNLIFKTNRTSCFSEVFKSYFVFRWE